MMKRNAFGNPDRSAKTYERWRKQRAARKRAMESRTFTRNFIRWQAAMSVHTL
jgi:hypothetical protein